jgi:hypothetical protein
MHKNQFKHRIINQMFLQSQESLQPIKLVVLLLDKFRDKTQE